MIVTCCVSLLVMLSIPQIGGGTNWPEAPRTVTMVGLPFEVARSGVTSNGPNHIEVPGIFETVIDCCWMTGDELTTAMNCGNPASDQNRSVLRYRASVGTFRKRSTVRKSLSRTTGTSVPAVCDWRDVSRMREAKSSALAVPRIA